MRLPQSSDTRGVGSSDTRGVEILQSLGAGGCDQCVGPMGAAIGSSGCDQWVRPVDVVTGCGH